MIWQRKDEDKIHLLPILSKTTQISNMELLLLVIPLSLSFWAFWSKLSYPITHFEKFQLIKKLYKETI